MLARGRGDAAAAQCLREQAQTLRQVIRKTFFDDVRGWFVDGEPAVTLIRRILRNDDPAIAKCGSYFWLYLLPTTARLGLHDEALARTRHTYAYVVQHDATTLWEIFAGDDRDSLCHP